MKKVLSSSFKCPSYLDVLSHLQQILLVVKVDLRSRELV